MKVLTTSKQFIKILSTFVQVVLVAALAVVAVMSFGTRIPALANLGFNFFGVTSGSMEPTIPTGSLVSVGKYRLEDLKAGQVITYHKTNPDTKQVNVVTHRIAKVDKKEVKQQTEENGKKDERVTITYTIKTKGDANSVEDSYDVNPGEIIGVYKWHVAKLGYVVLFAQQPQGFLILVIGPAAILILWEIIDLILFFRQHYEKKMSSEVTRLKKELEEAKQVKGSTNS